MLMNKIVHKKNIAGSNLKSLRDILPIREEAQRLENERRAEAEKRKQEMESLKMEEETRKREQDERRREEEKIKREKEEREREERKREKAKKWNLDERSKHHDAIRKSNLEHQMRVEAGEGESEFELKVTGPERNLGRTAMEDKKRTDQNKRDELYARRQPDSTTGSAGGRSPNEAESEAGEVGGPHGRQQSKTRGQEAQPAQPPQPVEPLTSEQKIEAGLEQFKSECLFSGRGGPGRPLLGAAGATKEMGARRAGRAPPRDQRERRGSQQDGPGRHDQRGKIAAAKST